MDVYRARRRVAAAGSRRWRAVLQGGTPNKSTLLREQSGPKRSHKHKAPTNNGFWNPLVVGLRTVSAIVNIMDSRATFEMDIGFYQKLYYGPC